MRLFIAALQSHDESVRLRWFVSFTVQDSYGEVTDFVFAMWPRRSFACRHNAGNGHAGGSAEGVPGADV